MCLMVLGFLRVFDYCVVLFILVMVRLLLWRYYLVRLLCFIIQLFGVMVVVLMLFIMCGVIVCFGIDFVVQVLVWGLVKVQVSVVIVRYSVVMVCGIVLMVQMRRIVQVVYLDIFFVGLLVFLVLQFVICLLIVVIIRFFVLMEQMRDVVGIVSLVIFDVGMRSVCMRYGCVMGSLIVQMVVMSGIVFMFCFVRLLLLQLLVVQCVVCFWLLFWVVFVSFMLFVFRSIVFLFFFFGWRLRLCSSRYFFFMGSLLFKVLFCLQKIFLQRILMIIQCWVICVFCYRFYVRI